MKTLVLKPRRTGLDYAFVDDGRTEGVVEGAMDGEWDAEDGNDPMTRLRLQCETEWRGAPVEKILRAAVVRGIYGGDEFSKPVVVDDQVERRLEAMASEAPLHMPILLSLLRRRREWLGGIPVALVFETSFFIGLPFRERSYALDPELTQRLKVRRYGFQGVFHESACRWFVRRRGLDPVRSRILSVCLEARPEAAAVMGLRPVMATSGVTPLEGLPGQTSCGEMDPSIVLTLAQKLGWGPEQIDAVLTRESGLSGLTGREVNLDEVFMEGNKDAWLARDVFCYRLLQMAGSAAAVMGGLDGVVFSGRYAFVGRHITPWLRQRMGFLAGLEHGGVLFDYFTQSFAMALVDTAWLALRGTRDVRLHAGLI
ncbi:MAG: hypothetical protein PHV34_13245 [Verrucomicrobiae bacterium]|nr:hypothetical protein [Verrucomicrobiae bacterium]